MVSSEIDHLKYLYTIRSVRETNKCTDSLLDSDGLHNFNVDLTKSSTVVDFVIETIKQKYPTVESLDTIPVHGRYQHFEGNGKPRLTDLIKTQWADKSDLEICRRLIDLFIVSVLLDAGAGNQWKYTESDGTIVTRSEGIAVASLDMFKNGLFSSQDDKYQVDGKKLASLDEAEFAAGLQVTKKNPIAGFEGRLELMRRLGRTLLEKQAVFGSDARPGRMVDYLLANKVDKSDGKLLLDLEDLWEVLMSNLQPIWPTEGRIRVYGEVIGDAWILQNRVDYCKKQLDTDTLPEWAQVVTFHKLLQWLTYSLFRPLTEYGKFEILNANYMTGLPEYRNGGLFVDLGLLSLKKDKLAKGLEFSKKVGFNPAIPTFIPEDDVIVEWRSCTICLLDRLLQLVNEAMGIAGTEHEMSLPQMIEAGSWSSGRRVAKQLRSNGGPPIELFADGTVF